MLVQQSVFAAEFLYCIPKRVEYIGMVYITAVSVAVRQEERSRRVVVIENDFHCVSLLSAFQPKHDIERVFEILLSDKVVELLITVAVHFIDGAVQPSVKSL